MDLRPATMADAPMLFAWRNDPVTRASSHQVGEIEYAGHVAWLERSLALSDRRIYIAEVNGVAVGTVRTDRGEDATEVSWTVAPDQRRQGYGTQMVRLAIESAGRPQRAEVKVGNIASEKIALAAGLLLTHEADGVRHFRSPAQSTQS